MKEDTDNGMVDLATGQPVVVDPATGVAKFKNRRGRPPKNPPPIVPVTAEERAARLAARAAGGSAAESAPASAPEPDEDAISLVPSPAPAAPAPEAAAEPESPSGSLAAAAGVDPDALLRARREAALRMKQGLDNLASSVNAMNAFFAAPPQKQAKGPGAPGANRLPLSPQQQEREAERERQRRREQSERDRERNRQLQMQRQQQSERDRERNRLRQQQQQQPAAAARPPETPPAEARPVLPPIKVGDLQALSAEEVLRLAAEQGVACEGGDVHETVFALLHEHVRRGGTVEADGYLELWQEGYGFLRSPLADFKSTPEDVAVPQAVVQRAGLRPGDRVVCRTRPAERGQRDRHFVATDVLSVNGLAPEKARLVVPFSSLAAAPASRPLRLGGPAPDPVADAFDRSAPLFFGSRALVLVPRGGDRAGVARAIASRAADVGPAAEVWFALFGATPEERAAAAAEPAFRDRRATMLCVDWEDPPEKYMQVSTVLAETLRVRAENGADAILVVDSLAALARAYGMVSTNQQGALTDGVDGRALQRARRLFATGRAFADRPGSVTVVALAERPEGSASAARLVDEFRSAATSVLVMPDRA